MIEEALILAGGVGSRLLPVTKGKYPKPLVKIIGNLSILELNINSLKKIGIKNLYVSTSHQYDEKIIGRLAHLGVIFLNENKHIGTGGSIYNFIVSTKQKKPFLALVGQERKALLRNPPFLEW